MLQYYNIENNSALLVTNSCNFDNFISLQVTIPGAAFSKVPYGEPYVYKMVNGF